MTNQFRNDGEMPPEIAACFPVVGQAKRVDGKPKIKRVASKYADETTVVLDYFAALFSLLTIATIVLADTPESLPGKMVFAAVPTLVFVVAVYFAGYGLDKLRR
jgi:hypothetical protein